MPDSAAIAAMFQASGGGGASANALDAPIDVCYPQNATVPGHDLSGGHKMQPAGVERDPKPMNKNPRSVDGQMPADGLMYDAEGFGGNK